MRTVPYRAVRDLFGELVANDSPDANAIASFGRLFGRVMRRGWGFQFWPETMDLQERRYRPTWAAGTYAEDDEVWHAATAAYYRCIDTTTTEEPSATPTDWEVLEMVDAYVAWEQTGEDEIGRFKEIWSENFRESRSAFKLKFELDDRGARLTENSVPASVWVYFQVPCPNWIGADYSAGATYAVGTTRYYSGSADSADAFYGDFWTTIAATTAGQNPETHPAKWAKVEVPAFMTDFAAHTCKLGYNEGDGQLDKALQAGGEAWAWLYDEMDRLQAQGGQYRKVRAGNLG